MPLDTLRETWFNVERRTARGQNSRRTEFLAPLVFPSEAFDHEIHDREQSRQFRVDLVQFLLSDSVLFFLLLGEHRRLIALLRVIRITAFVLVVLAIHLAIHAGRMRRHTRIDFPLLRRPLDRVPQAFERSGFSQETTISENEVQVMLRRSRRIR